MELLRHIFGFDSESPLLFTQFYFWAFFALVYSLFALIMEIGAKHSHRKNSRLHLRNVFLMGVSWFFYYKTSGLFLLILVFVTLSDWLIANRIYRNKEQGSGSGQRKAKMWLALSVVIDLGLLCYFKYA